MLKKIWEWIKRPHGFALIAIYILTALFIAGSIVFSIVGKGKSYSFVAYIFYVFAVISLAYTIYSLTIVIPKLKQSIVEQLKKYKFTHKLYEHYGFRTIIFAIAAFAISFGNAIINVTIGLIYLSVWYCALGAYYLLLSAMRGGVLLYHRNKNKYEQSESQAQIRIREIKVYVRCGAGLVLLPLALSFAILEMVISNKAFVHAGLMIYVSAAYTFYKIITSIIHFFKARRGDEITVRAIRNVNLADALVSVLALQTAMLHEFSQNLDAGYANAIVGGIVCALTIVIGIFMIGSGYKKIKKIKSESEVQNER